MAGLRISLAKNLRRRGAYVLSTNVRRRPSTPVFAYLLAAGLGAQSVAAAEPRVAVQTVRIADGIYQFITDPDGYVPNGNSG